jgi:baculoviral IAP repeat-containing protein 7/8
MSVLNVEDCLRTFTNWPDTAPVSAIDLAVAGFMYTGEGDRVICVYCRGILHSWQPGDVPAMEHSIYYPDCPSIDEDYIPFDLPPPFDIPPPLAHVVPNSATLDEGFQEEAISVEPIPESLLCRVCVTHERDTVLLPCFHLVLCVDCRSRLASCPVCRQPITGSIKVFLS